MKLIVGLGNPGSQYQNTRHNIGFMFIDRYAKEKHCEEDFKEKFNGMYVKTSIHQEDVLLFKPLTFMNLSGQAVRRIAEFFKINHKDILIVYDDKDIPFSALRLREKGNPGSHNGMKNITLELQDTSFPRLRIGIGQPMQHQDMVSFVLSKFTKEEKEVLEKSFQLAMKAADLFVDNKFKMAMNLYNTGKNHE